MTTLHWLGTADAVAQIGTASIDSVDATPANNTFTVTIGGVAISQVGDTDVATTAAALVVLLEASTHPYFAAVTWTNPSAGTIIGTADTAGVPFVAALTETGAGTGAVTDFAGTTAAAGANDWSTADNWSTGAVPVAADDVIIGAGSVNIAWGLDQSALDLASLTILQSYTGKIGLNSSIFATDITAETGSTVTKDEYRQAYLDIGWDACDIGQNFSPTVSSGSTRLKLDNDKAGASTTTVHNTASAASETGESPVKLLAAHANADVYVRAGSVGIAKGLPGEVSTVGIVSSSGGNIFVGDGVTLTTFEQTDGSSIVQAAATVTTVTVEGGTVTLEGIFTVTTLNVNGGTVNANNTSGSNAITTANVNDGTLDGSQSSEPRTWATVSPDGGAIIIDDGVVTITTFDQPSGSKTVSIT